MIDYFCSAGPLRFPVHEQWWTLPVPTPQKFEMPPLDFSFYSSDE